MIIETFGKFCTCGPVNEFKMATIALNEEAFVDNLKTKIMNASTYYTNLIVNLTWFFPDSETELLVDWVKEHCIDKSDTKIYLVASLDGGEWFLHTHSYDMIAELVADIELVGFGPNDWSSWFPAWMTQYQENDVMLDPAPKYVYLSYNRKPKPHRHEFVNHLIENDILKYGWTTYEHGTFPQVDFLSGDSDIELEYSGPFSRPEDLTTLGNLEIWKNSYCIIVSETEPTDPWQITEKTWKPIMGMRPFLINGNANITNLLRNLGFYTPSDFFQNKELDDCSSTSMIKQLEILCTKSPIELREMWDSQQELLRHNLTRFKELAIEWKF